MIKRNALGRGLDALITMDEVKTSGSSSINEINIDLISPNPDQPRTEFDEEALNELATSIKELGIIQPISLRKMSNNSYQIIAGERRYRAAKRAGLKSLPAYVRTVEDETVPLPVPTTRRGFGFPADLPFSRPSFLKSRLS